MKQCKKCKEEKPLTDFGVNNSLKDKRQSKCKVCFNPEKRIAGKKWQDNNKDKSREATLDWQGRNKDKIRDYNKQYWSDKRARDPLFQLKDQLRKNISASIKHNGWEKESKTTKLLGAEYDEVFTYFNKLWQEKYNEPFKTDALYEIHHIVHCQTANTEEELIKLQHYTNLQPLTPEDHRKIHSKDGGYCEHKHKKMPHL